ncbi:MAG: SDR family oxidoreductase [Methylobacteriaceae bacterium]|nr:SDR family oxidoreductase [Methylobacteriaceae bacterium]
MAAAGLALVTGGSRNIGAAICRRLHADGHEVVNLDRIAPEAPVPGRWIEVDLSDAEATGRVLARIVAEQPVLRLVNNVGMIRPASLDKTRLEDFSAVMSLNVRTAIQCVQAVAPGMRQAHFGRIVSISSRAVLGKELRTSYSASKAAIHGLTRTWALELARDGITVNAVAPGTIDTSLFHEANPPDDPRTQAIFKAIPVGRIGTPTDVAHAVSFFLDERSSFITGQALFVCGGLTVGLTQ